MPADLADLLRDAPRYTSTAVVDATRLAQRREWHTGRGSAMTAAAGDWLVTNGDDEWTVAAEVFERSYRRRPDGRFGKVAVVSAVRLDEAVEVPTLEGPSTAAAGDWVLRGESGDMWPVSDDHFRASYSREAADGT